MRKVLGILLALVLVFSFASCNETPATSSDASSDVTSSKDVVVSLWDNALYTEDTTVGEGEKTVYVEVKAEEKSITFTINTNATILGDALIENNLIAGEEGAYGLYVKTVNGILADYDVDSTYWGFFKDGEYMMTGVDTTEISGGEHYELVRTK